MCETMDLIKQLSKIDFINKHIGISFENQLLKKFGNLFKIQYIFVSFTIIRLLLQNFLINSDETELLIVYADPGYYVGKNNTRNMLNIIYISYLFFKLYLIVIDFLSQVYFIGIASKQIVDQIFLNNLTSTLQILDLSVSFIDLYFLFNGIDDVNTK